jgi:beta-phosphoglucomutase
METTEGRLTPVRGIAFDLEGTIIDLEELHHAAHIRAAQDVGLWLSWQEALDNLPHFVGGPDENVAAEIAFLAGRSTSITEIIAAKRMYFNELVQNRNDILPRDGFNQLISWVKGLGIGIAIGTVSPRAVALQLLGRANLSSYFSDAVIVAREDVSAPKPAPDVYCETARRIGISPASQLVFEDSVVGLNSARTAGCRSVAVPTILLPSFVQFLYDAEAEAVFMSWNDPDIRAFILQSIEV